MEFETSSIHARLESMKILVNVALNVVLPSLIMTRLAGSDHLGPLWALVVALLFPVVFGLYEFRVEHKVNFFSVIGFSSVLLTGGLGVLQADNRWIVAKETGVPLIIGLAVLISQKTRWPLVYAFFRETLDIEKMHATLRERAQTVHTQTNQTDASHPLDHHFRRVSYWLAGTFFLSSLLNFILARTIVVSPPGTSAFTEELGRLTALSFPIIALPTGIVFMLIVFFLLRSLQRTTGLAFEELLK